MLNFENCNKAIFSGVPPYGIPQIIPENIKISELEWIPFNYANTAKDRSKKGVHFYVDDYQFSRLWNRPDDYISMLSELPLCVRRIFHNIPICRLLCEFTITIENIGWSILANERNTCNPYNLLE